MFVKICGITNLEDALAAIDAGADALGFNFYSESPRVLNFEQAYLIGQEIPPSVLKVGVFVDQDFEEVRDLAQSLELDLLQFHGNETPEYCAEFGRDWMKAFRLKDEESLEDIAEYDCDLILVDAYKAGYQGGTGVCIDFRLAKEAKKMGKKIILAGGLNPQNIALAIAEVDPYGVDVASGVEKSAGIKDHLKLQEFVEKAKTLHLRAVD